MASYHQFEADQAKLMKKCKNPECSNESIVLCVRCGTKYCSKTCQSAHWSIHKPSCKKGDLTPPVAYAPYFNAYSSEPILLETGNMLLRRVYVISTMYSFEEANDLAYTFTPDDAMKEAANILRDLNESAVENASPEEAADIRFLNEIRRSEDNTTLLMEFCSWGADRHDRIIGLIINGADWKIANDSGSTAADYCADPNMKKFLRMLG